MKPTGTKTSSPKATAKPGSKSPRRRAREFALQGIYTWLLSGSDIVQIAARQREVAGFDKADQALFESILSGVLANAAALETRFAPHLDRPAAELAPIERGLLLLACHEFVAHPETPYKVVINEAVEIAKDYGGTDGHKYVNGVLDKLARELRAAETGQRP